MASVVGYEASSFSTGRALIDRDKRLRDVPSSAAVLNDSTVDDAAKSAGSLTCLIESEIIPRMMAAHLFDVESHDDASDVADAASVSADDVEAFAPLALALEADALLGLVERMLHRGVSVDTLLVDLLAPTARRLGEYWEDDRCDFVDVTMGLWRLQEVVRNLVGDSERDARPGVRRALFATMPGDQHSFGTVVIDEIFRHAGWNTLRLGDAEPMELIGQVAGEWFDLIGMTVTRDGDMAQVRSLIAAMRNVSRNPQACVMVGGRIFVDNPGLAVNVGADGTARDARMAAVVAARLVDARQGGSVRYG